MPLSDAESFIYIIMVITVSVPLIALFLRKIIPKSQFFERIPLKVKTLAVCYRNSYPPISNKMVTY